MTAITRSFRLQYGSGVDVGGSSAFYLIHGPIDRSSSYGSESIGATVVITAANAADLETKSESLIAGMRTPRQTITLTLGANVRTWAEGVNAIGIEPTIQRAPGPHDTHSSRTFRLSFIIAKEADATDDDGLIDYDYSVVIAQNGTRAVSISAKYSLYNGDDAEDVYAAQFQTLADAILDEVVSGAEWEEGSRATQHDRFKRVLTVTTAYQEQIYGENAAGTYENAIKSQSIIGSVTLIKGTGAIRDMTAPVNVSVNYSAVVDKDVSQDLHAIYNSVARPFIREYAKGFIGNVEPPIVQETYTTDPVANTIAATILFRIYGIGNGVLTASISVSYDFAPPAVAVPSNDVGGFGRFLLPATGHGSCVIAATLSVLGELAAAESAIALMPTKPSRTKLGGDFRATANVLMTPEQWNRLGVDGGEWIRGRVTDAVDGPVYDDGDPQIAITTISRTIPFEYVTAPLTNVNVSVER